MLFPNISWELSNLALVIDAMIKLKILYSVLAIFLLLTCMIDIFSKKNEVQYSDDQISCILKTIPAIQIKQPPLCRKGIWSALP